MINIFYGLLFFAGTWIAISFIRPENTKSGLGLGVLIGLFLGLSWAAIRVAKAYPVSLPFIVALVVALGGWYAWSHNAVSDGAKRKALIQAVLSMVLSGALAFAGCFVMVVAIGVGLEVYTEFKAGDLSFSSSMALAIIGILFSCGLFFARYGYLWAQRTVGYLQVVKGHES